MGHHRRNKRSEYKQIITHDELLNKITVFPEYDLRQFRNSDYYIDTRGLVYRKKGDKKFKPIEMFIYHGYVCFIYYTKRRGKNIKKRVNVHRAVAEIYYNDYNIRETNLTVHHIENKYNNAINNLFICSREYHDYIEENNIKVSSNIELNQSIGQRKEIFRPIKGFEDYLVTDTGRVYSLKSRMYLKFTRVNSNYLQAKLWKQNKMYSKYVHRLVADAFLENSENKPTVDHINRNRTDNRVENLRWATRSEQAKNTSNVGFDLYVKNRRQKIYEITDNTIIFYPSFSSVEGFSKSIFSKHFRKHDFDFYCKGRHFIIPHEDME